MTPERTSVLVVGGGPTGLLASLLLERCGIDHIVLERRSSAQQAPAAHVINTRTMEILRAAGMDTKRLYALNRHADAQYVSWVSGLRDRAIGRFRLVADEAAEAHRQAVSPEHITNISQPLLETALFQEADARTGIDIRRGHSWQSFRDGDTTISEVTDSSGNGYSIAAKYVFAADGAGSPIARALGIRKIGPEALATFLNLSCAVDVTGIAGEPNSLLYWCLDPRTPGVLIVHDPHALTVYMRPLHEPYESLDDYDDARCRRIAADVFGPDVPVSIIHKGVWRMTAQVAEHFSIGNVFLVGDAAHRFPPTGGLGLNSGAADVHNLVWKVAAVLAHAAPDALLSSYTEERKPVAEFNCTTSANNFAKMREVTDALGMDADKAHLPARLRGSALLRLLPGRLVDALLDALATPVRRTLQAACADTDRGRALRAGVEAAVTNQAEHFDMLGAELGYVYRSGPAVDASAARTPGNSVRAYTPVAAAGARLPHVWLEVQGHRRSALDLIDYRRFTLFVHGEPGTDSARANSFGMPVQRIALDDLPADSCAAACAAFDLAPGGWLLVRPDGHVAQRS